MVKVLDATLTGAPSRSPACAALSMLRVSADANTSAGAPWVSCVTRSEEPAKENSTDVPGLSVLNCSPMAVNEDFNDAAANTMRCLLSAAAVVEGLGPGDEGFDPEPHPAISDIDSAPASATAF